MRLERTKRKVPPLEDQDEAWLRALAPRFARSLDGVIDVERLVAPARRLASAIERSDVGDSATAARRDRAETLDRRANVLEHVCALHTQAMAERDRALARVAPHRIETIRRHAPAIAAFMDGAALDEAGHQATDWMLGLGIEAVHDLALVVRVEREIRSLEELRRRAYHALAAVMARSFGVKERPLASTV